MCGVLGSPEFTPNVRALLPWLSTAMEERGKDSWGASDGYEIIRHIGKITSTYGEEVERFAGWEQGFIHTRGASVGSAKDIINTHPFTATYPDGRQIIGIHNGHIGNHLDLNKTHQRECTVDSQHIWHHLAEGKTWEDLRGWANLAWWAALEGDEAPTLHLARFHSVSLHVFRVEDGGMIFCSSAEPVELACRMLGQKPPLKYSIEEGVEYTFGWNAEGMVHIYKGAKLPFSPPQANPTPAPVTSYNYGSDFQRGYGSGAGRHFPIAGREGILCALCSQKVSKEKAICDRCLGDIAMEFVRDNPEVLTTGGV